VDQEHADPGAVLRGVADLLDFQGGGIERHARPPPDPALAGGKVDLVKGGRLVEAGVAEECRRPLRRGDQAGGAEARQGELALRLAVQGEELDPGDGALQVLGGEQPAGRRETLQRRVPALGDHLAPSVRSSRDGIAEVDGHHPLVGRVQAGGHIEGTPHDGVPLAVDVREAALGLPANHDRPALGFTRAQPFPEVHHPEVVDAAAHPVPHDRPAAVRAETGEGAPGGGARSFLVLLDQCAVLPRVGTDAVEADPPGGGVLQVGEMVVEEAGGVRQPLDLAHLARDLVRQPRAGLGVEKVEGGVLVPGPEQSEGDEPAVGAGLVPGDRREAAGIDGGRIEEHARRAAVPRHQQGGLLLVPLDPPVEEAVSPPGHVPLEPAASQGAEARRQLIAPGEAVEHGPAIGVLGVGPGTDPGVERGVGGSRVEPGAPLEPAVGIDDLDAVQDLPDRPDLGQRRSGRRGCRARRGGQERDQELPRHGAPPGYRDSLRSTTPVVSQWTAEKSASVSGRGIPRFASDPRRTAAPALTWPFPL
jgi:hypothetical protein